ncbi:MAG TPA: hypothetical protein VGI85_11385 [Chthoniobacterales bacterium]|jgi:hypothetical protein
MDTFTLAHVAISLIGIFSGLIVLSGLLRSERMDGWTLLFLITTVATSVTGFFFPVHGITPGIILGILSLVVLVFAIVARYGCHLAGSWRWVYVVGAVVALYLNFVVLVVQSFLHIPRLHFLAPNGSEPPFAIVQGIVFLFFVVAAILAVRRFRPTVAA